MKKTIAFLIVFSFIILINCKKENFDNDSIIGQWQWLMSYMGDFSYAKTPETVDSTYCIEFNKDGYYTLFDNSKNQISRLKYELITNDQIGTFKFVDPNSSVITYGYSIKHDTLSVWNLNGIIWWTDLYTRLK